MVQNLLMPIRRLYVTLDAPHETRDRLPLLLCVPPGNRIGGCGGSCHPKHRSEWLVVGSQAEISQRLDMLLETHSSERAELVDAPTGKTENNKNTKHK